MCFIVYCSLLYYNYYYYYPTLLLGHGCCCHFGNSIRTFKSFYWQLSLRSMNSFKYRCNKAIDHEDYSNVIIIFMADYHRIIICHEDFSTNLKIIYDFIIYLCWQSDTFCPCISCDPIFILMIVYTWHLIWRQTK